MTKKIEVSIEDPKEAAAEKLGVIKKQSEVWVYDDEVYATRSRAASAALVSRLGEPLYRSYLERSGYGATEIPRQLASAKKSGFKGNYVYIEDVAKILPGLIEELSVA